MATYISLFSFTDQGIRSVKETTRRAEAAKELAKKYGATLKAVYWTLGQYDLVAILEAPDAAQAAAFGMAIGSMGNIRGQTLTAFTAQEVDGMLGKLP
ncbi:MAG TPA: GYD domain-containing protein [Burkholderiales bacterium]